jgi:uncharacterized protein YjiS (DUF1127 family)
VPSSPSKWLGVAVVGFDARAKEIAMTTTSDVDVSVSAASPAWSRVRKFLAGVVNTLFVWHARSSDRGRLLVMDDRMLRDIGVSRAAVRQEAMKPFWRN